jgi:hypothetical protein
MSDWLAFQIFSVKSLNKRGVDLWRGSTEYSSAIIYILKNNDFCRKA